MLTCAISCRSSWQLWEKHPFLFSIVRQCKSSSASHSTTLEIQTISEFLLRTQALVDALTEIGDFVSSKEQLDIILQGLPEEYESTVSIISSRFDPLSIDEVEAMVMKLSS